jgi:DNA-binding transcriptional regulator YiaG
MKHADAQRAHRVRLMSKVVTLTEAEFYRTLVTQLRARRQALGKTQLDVAMEIGVSDYMIAKWEGLFKMPTAFGLMCWCQVLDVSLELKLDD